VVRGVAANHAPLTGRISTTWACHEPGTALSSAE
jgi:hypothetical protein